VESVIEMAQEFAAYRAESGTLYSKYDTITSELARAVEIAREVTDYDDVRAEFYRHYSGEDYITYGQSQANEVLSKGLALFLHTKGNPKDAILAAVNFGRDTDCLAAVAGGLAGALSGTESIPKRWTSQVNWATQEDAYTNNQRSIEDTADELHRAYRARIARVQAYTQMMREVEPD
jgi:ADP-ribosylglycohydrolase